MAEILIADDERLIRDGMKALFVGEGFSVRTARDGAEALEKFRAARPDLVVLDVMMPKANGFRACEEIRKLDPLVPVLFLTAKDAESDQVRGLGLGADDYVSKTAGDAVLLARIRRALERAAAVDGELASPRTLRLGSVTVDLDGLAVADGKGRACGLTKTEADILRLLATHPGELLTADALIEALRGRGFVCADGLLYSHIYNLRRKLGAAADLLVCERGAGYRLVL